MLFSAMANRESVDYDFNMISPWHVYHLANTIRIYPLTSSGKKHICEAIFDNLHVSARGILLALVHDGSAVFSRIGCSGLIPCSGQPPGYGSPLLGR